MLVADLPMSLEPLLSQHDATYEIARSTRQAVKAAGRSAVALLIEQITELVAWQVHKHCFKCFPADADRTKLGHRFAKARLFNNVAARLEE